MAKKKFMASSLAYYMRSGMRKAMVEVESQELRVFYKEYMKICAAQLVEFGLLLINSTCLLGNPFL